MIRRLLSITGIGTALFGLTACEGRIPGVSGAAANGTGSQTASVNVDIGAPLYEPLNVPAAPRPASTGTQVDPIVVQGAQITIPKTENVPSKNNGTLWQICTELAPGQQCPPEDVFEHPMVPGKKYRRLKEGDTVVRGQLIGLLDDRQARAKFNAAVTDRLAAVKSMEAQVLVKDAALSTLNVMEKLKAGNAGAVVELNKAKQEWATAEKQYADALGQQQKSVESENVAKVQLDEHELRASIDGKIKTIYRQPGESVKELEPVLLIENLNTLRVEGGVPIQYLPYLNNPVGRKVLLEPAAQLGPLQEFIGHWAPVSGVAVSKDARKPLIVTVSDDKTLRVWDQKSRSQVSSYSHETPIRAVACTGVKSQLNLAIFGADDGYGYLINLDGSGEAIKKLDKRHKGRIVSVAFSPDGLSCATADDKEIIVWNTDTGKERYTIAANHRGPITSIQFTPQTKLVSAARDRTVRVWDLGDKGAKLNNVLDNRSGNVDFLGVSPDGQRILFDQDRAMHVRNMNDQRTEAVLPAPTDSTQFTGFAVFSHDGSLAITGGTGDNPLGVWKLPTSGSNRAFQRARLAVGNSVPTCAAVAPEGGFVVIGTADNRVLVFARPEKADLEKQYPATITRLDQALDSTDRRLRMWAECPNPGMPLIPGDTLPIVIPIQ